MRPDASGATEPLDDETRLVLRDHPRAGDDEAASAQRASSTTATMQNDRIGHGH